MKYISTRGKTSAIDFEEVLLAGLAPDGGLYVPENYPQFSKEQLRKMRSLTYPELAAEIMAPFTNGCLSKMELTEMAKQAYHGFSHTAVAPLKQISDGVWVLELFYGPTLAFKDYALQIVGRMFDAVLKRTNRHITILGATSGDTGSAAIEACKGCPHLDIFILHPHNRVSEVQRRQMTTTIASNVYNIALQGTFDDCQAAVKALFADEAFRKKHDLSAVNSINWARIMAQIVYYFHAALALGSPDREVSFAVPTGNFGNIFAGYVAKRMGLPIRKLVLGSNENDILPRFLETGVMEKREVRPSISPSMDIQVSSNFERLLFEMLNRDAAEVSRLMGMFRYENSYQVKPDVLDRIQELFAGLRCSDEETKAQIRDVYAAAGELLDPHSAIGFAAAAKFCEKEVPSIVLATAHPSKFPAPVREATGITPVLPSRLSDLMTRRESFTVLPNTLDSIKYFVETASQKGALND
ncbi:MAG: threonine synthase [Alphaproteobacteria bacterium]|nr:threonine synthase [Alphaproteobacteria bacterium]